MARKGMLRIVEIRSLPTSQCVDTDAELSRHMRLRYSVFNHSFDSFDFELAGILLALVSHRDTSRKRDYTLNLVSIESLGDQIVVGVVSNGATDISSAVPDAFDLNVLSNDPLVLAQEDLALIFADLLAEDQSEKSIYGSAQSFMRVLTPAKFVNQLAQNYPNPFNPQTTLAFSIKSASHVSLTVYDVAGRQVRELVSGHRAPGVYKAVWDGTDGRGARVASGVYFYKLVAGSFSDTKKMILLK